MTSETAFARQLADAVLFRLQADGAPAWAVLEVTHAVDKTPPLWDPGDVADLLITLGDASTLTGIAGVYFTVGVPLVDAIVATADQIQGHMLEVTRGAPLPACPEHQHPLQAMPREGIPMWVCPQDPAHHAEPIVPERLLDLERAP